MDWSLFGCARQGHVTYAPDEPELRNRLMAPTAGGVAWRCLRCGAFVTGGEHGSGPAAAAPLVRRGRELRSELILRVFAVERFLRFLVIGVAAYGVWLFKYDQAAVQRHVKGYADSGAISRYAVPDRVLFIEAIEKTSVGKLNKKLLRERYSREH